VRHFHDRMSGCLLALVVAYLLPGCGLLFDAAKLMEPLVPNLWTELDLICQHKRLQVGIAVEPLPPFVFPVAWTYRGPIVTGLDIEVIHEITKTLSKYCGGTPVTAALHVVHFRDLFRLLTEGHLDLFLSSVAYNVPHPSATGLAFSTPYYYEGGIGVASRRPEVVERVRAALRQPSRDGDILADRRNALAGLTVAGQEGRSPYIWAEAELKNVRLVACDTLYAAFDSQDPPIDVILMKQPILDFIAKRERSDWQPVTLETEEPLLLSRELYTVVMAEQSFQLQWLINDLLFQLEQTGRLEAMRRRWFDEDYVYTVRAMREGLRAIESKLIHTNEHGRCRLVR